MENERRTEKRETFFARCCLLFSLSTSFTLTSSASRSNFHSNFKTRRLQRRDRRVQEHLVHRVGRWRPGQGEERERERKNLTQERETSSGAFPLFEVEEETPVLFLCLFFSMTTARDNAFFRNWKKTGEREGARAFSPLQKTRTKKNPKLTLFFFPSSKKTPSIIRSARSGATTSRTPRASSSSSTPTTATAWARPATSSTAC